MSAIWPEIPCEAWRETCSALHLYCQVVGKYRLARTPWVNHSWHATFYVNARGLTTSLVPDASGVESSFDLAVTRFSGRPAPLHPGGVPGLPDEVTREAYSDEVSSAGFWPGGGGTDFAAFYSYAYPTPNGFADEQILPTGAYFDQKLGE